MIGIITLCWLTVLFASALGGRRTYAHCPVTRGAPVVGWRDQSGHHRDVVQAP
jgi:hypothetical protein